MKSLFCAVILALSGGICESSRAADFRSALAEDCRIANDGKLEATPANAFANTKLFVVYYATLGCTTCEPTTAKLNAWAASAPTGVSVILAYRAAADREELAKFLKQSHITFPALDPKWFRARGRNTHPFYKDPNDTVPRIRFFNADGKELDLELYGFRAIHDAEAIVLKLDSLVRKMP